MTFRSKLFFAAAVLLLAAGSLDGRQWVEALLGPNGPRDDVLLGTALGFRFGHPACPDLLCHPRVVFGHRAKGCGSAVVGAAVPGPKAGKLVSGNDQRNDGASDGPRMAALPRRQRMELKLMVTALQLYLDNHFRRPKDGNVMEFRPVSEEGNPSHDH